MTKEVKFKNPSFAQRIKGMLGVDFYRLFHTPMFYIFLGIAAIIPALVSMGGGRRSLYIYNRMADYCRIRAALRCKGHCGLCQHEYGLYFRWYYGFYFYRP